MTYRIADGGHIQTEFTQSNPLKLFWIKEIIYGISDRICFALKVSWIMDYRIIVELHQNEWVNE